MYPRSLISLGSLLVLTACSQAPQNEQTAVPSPSNGGAAAPVAVAQNFPKPVVSPAAVLPVPTVPGLITPTNARMRIPTIVTGRTDPFAAVSTAPIRLAAATNKPAVTLPSPLPAPRQGQLPAFNPLPVTPAPANLPPLPPALPQLPVSRTALADAIEISGVIKVGGRWSVIVKEPEAQTSRYVHAGAYLSNGQVLVKRIVASAGSDPIVILQQNGVEITRTIGGSARLASK
ncbi:MAG: hypothetical protein KME45_00465 [Stenomitos rutilans HA7619-LM2]|nr:hypothetical protein [Stenomitos rutilans HA7619-LM2]